MPPYAVVQETYDALSAEELAPILESSLGLLRFDAQKLAKEARGLVAENLDGPTAQALAGAIQVRGAPVRILHQHQVVRIGRPALVREVGIADDAFSVALGYTGDMHRIPWDYVWLLSAGELQEVVSRPGGPDSRTWKRRAAFLGQFPIAAGAVQAIREVEGLDRLAKAKKTMAIEVADVFASTPEGEFLHVRLRSRDLYYDRILGAQSRRNFAADFRLVLLHVATRAGRAVATAGFRALALEGTDPDVDPEDAKFGDEAEFTRYNRWQLQMLALRWWEAQSHSA